MAGDTSSRRRPVLDGIEGAGATLADQVAQAVRRAVERGELVPGQIYSAYQLADLLGVSRSPVREALMRLAESGMVRFERNRGFRVVLPDPRQLAEIFQLRLLLEVPATRAATAQRSLAALRTELAAMRQAAAAQDEVDFMSHDQRFHDLLLAGTGNDRLVSTVDELRSLTRLVGASTVDRSRSLDDIADEHAPVLDALERGDADAAADALRAHLLHTGRLLVTQSARDQGLDDAGRDVLIQTFLPGLVGAEPVVVGRFRAGS